MTFDDLTVVDPVEPAKVGLPSLDDVTVYVNALYFGDPGTGKTTASQHAAKGGKVIAVDAEAGIKARPLRRLGVPTSNIIPYKVKSYADLDRLYWQTKATLEQNPESIYAVVFDSVTEIQKLLLEELVETRHNKAARMAQISGTVNKDDPFEIDREEYGKMTEQLRRLCRRFRDLDCHVIFVALAKSEVDQTAGELYHFPALTPAFKTDLIGYVDVVICTTQDETDNPDDPTSFLGHTRPTGRYRGKDRYGVLPPVLANPTFDRVVEYVVADENGVELVDPYQEAYLARLRGPAES